jgi:hypothetical protein
MLIIESNFDSVTPIRPEIVLAARRGRGLQEEQTMPHATSVETDVMRYRLVVLYMEEIYDLLCARCHVCV